MAIPVFLVEPDGCMWYVILPLGLLPIAPIIIPIAAIYRIFVYPGWQEISVTERVLWPLAMVLVTVSSCCFVSYILLAIRAAYS